MLAKIVLGNDFSGCLKYVCGKTGAVVLGGNMVGDTVPSLAAEFNLVASASNRIKYPVMHVSFSPHPDEELSDRSFKDFVSEYFKRMGMGECQWILVKHTDTITPDKKERPHCHAVANRVSTSTLKAVKSSWTQLRSQKILAQLGKEFNLKKSIKEKNSSAEKKSPSTSQIRRYRAEKEQYDNRTRSTPPEPLPTVKLQNAIDEAARQSTTMPQLIKQLHNSGVPARVKFSSPDRIQGILYPEREYTYSGSYLGKAYSFGGLQKYRQINYNPERDNETLKKLSQIAQEQLQSLHTPKQPSPSLKEEEEDEITDITSSSSENNFNTKAFSKDKETDNSEQPPVPNFPLKVPVFDKESPEQEESNKSHQHWEKARDYLMSKYKFPLELCEVLKDNGKLDSDRFGNPLWLKQPLVGQQTNNPAFWIGTKERVERAVINDNPVETVSAFLVEKELQKTSPTIYLSVDKIKELPVDFLLTLKEISVNIQTQDKRVEILKQLPNAKNIADHKNSWNDDWQHTLKLERLDQKSPSVKTQSKQTEI